MSLLTKLFGKEEQLSVAQNNAKLIAMHQRFEEMKAEADEFEASLFATK